MQIKLLQVVLPKDMLKQEETPRSSYADFILVNQACSIYLFPWFIDHLLPWQQRVYLLVEEHKFW